jgi:hypothetical protein
MSQAFDAMTAIELRDRIARREISPVEVTRRALEKAQATQASLNAFFFLMPEKALAAAKGAEEAVMRGDPLGALHGGQHCGGRRASGGAGQSCGRDRDRQDHDQRIGLQGRR